MSRDDGEIVLERHREAPDVSVNPFAGLSIDAGGPNVDNDECQVDASSDDYPDPPLDHIDDGRSSSSSSLSSVESPSHSQPTIPPSQPKPLSTQQQIDNTILVYVPIKLKCGVTIQCRPSVLIRCREVIKDLNLDLQQCLRVLPHSVHSLVKRTQIWVNEEYSYGPTSGPRHLKHTTTHHHAGWLVAIARDRPTKAQSIELYSCVEYRRNRVHYNGAGLLLHEFCHLLHQLVLPDGLENAQVQDLYSRMMESGKYNCVIRRDWAGWDCEHDMHYCTVNYKEMWAELSVTYLADGYLSVKTADDIANVSMAEFSPPLPSSDDRDVLPTKGIKWFMNSLFRRKGIANHCNKFYPFTREQFEAFDPELFDDFARLWRYIQQWENEEDDVSQDKLCWGIPGRSCMY